MFPRYADDHALIHDIGDLQTVTLEDGWAHDAEVLLLKEEALRRVLPLVQEISTTVMPGPLLAERNGRRILTALGWARLAGGLGVTTMPEQPDIDYGTEATVHPEWGIIPDEALRHEMIHRKEV